MTSTWDANSGCMHESVTFVSKQRDGRTSIYVKQTYLATTVVTCILAIVISCMMFNLYAKYSQTGAAGIIFVIIAVILGLFALFVMIVNMVALFNTDFMWMKPTFAGGKQIGRDILDCNPHAIDNFTNWLRGDTDRAYYRLQKYLNAEELKILNESHRY